MNFANLGVMGRLLVLTDRFTFATYAILTLAALGSAFVPALHSLVAHGKTRRTQRRTSPPAVRTRKTASTSLGAVADGVIDTVWNGMLVPKSYFTHFYVVGLASLIGWRGHSYYNDGFSYRNNNYFYNASFLGQLQQWPLAEGLLFVQLLRRLTECLFVHRWNPGSRMHGAVYLVGLAHYLFLPMVFFPLDAAGHHHQQQQQKNTTQSANHTNTDVKKPFFFLSLKGGYPLIFGSIALALVCLWAQYQQLRHHIILANLRCRRATDDDGDDKVRCRYDLPHGAWFQYVSCPHYTAEILVYISMVACHWYHHDALVGERGFDTTTLATTTITTCRWRMGILLFWVVLNLIINGRQSHRWYLDHIPGYAQLDRFAILPGIV